MAFAGKVWKLLVAIKDGLALILLLLFFLALYAVLTMRPSAGSVRDGALLLKLDGAIVEEPSQPNPLELLLANQAPLHEYAARDLIRALRAAATDARIKAVVLDLSHFTGAGQVTVTDVGAALDAVRAHKPVLAFAQLYGDDGIQLAAHASEVWIDPMGAAIPTGPGGTHLYYGPLLERFKVDAHVFRVGTFKSAVEPYIRGDMSPEAKENYRALYGALWEDWKADVSRARPRANLAMATADPVGWVKASNGDMARAALAAGLVDRIGDEAAFGERVAQIAGRSDTTHRPGSYANTPLDTWLAANKPATPGKAIGVVTVAGDIVPGEAGPGTAGGERIARLLDDALDEDLAGLVVRVDSPGGAVIAGERIRSAIARFRAKHIPVVVSMANLAASGGYWVTTPANRIFAEPATVTGSIGVFAVIPTVERTLAQYGVHADGFRTTPLSGQPDLTAGLSPEFSAILQAEVEDTYARFLSLVGKSRGRTTQQIDGIAQGRVWDGGSARQLGLVDQFGNLDDALAYAAKAAKLTDGGWHARFLGREPSGLARLLAAMVPSQNDDRATASDWVALASRRQIDEVSQALAGALRMNAAGGLQAYCSECPVTPAAVQPAPRETGVLAELLRLLPFKAE